MQTISLFLNQSISHFRERLLPSSIDKKIVLIASTALLCLAATFLVIYQAFKKPPLLAKPFPENEGNKNPLQAPLEKEEHNTDLKSVPSPNPTLLNEDPREKLLTDLGAENFVASLSTDEMKEIVQKWQKDQRTLLKLSQLFKEVFSPSDCPDLESWFQCLIESVEKGDLETLMKQGGTELRIVCIPHAILKILQSNEPSDTKKAQIDCMLSNFYDLWQSLFGYTTYENLLPQEQSKVWKRAEVFNNIFCFYLARFCPPTEYGTLLRAYCNFGYSNTMRQLLSFFLLHQAFEKKDLTLINPLMAVYWTCWKILDYGAKEANLCQKTVLGSITSEEILRVVYSAIPDTIQNDEKEEIKKLLRKVKLLSPDIINRVLS